MLCGPPLFRGSTRGRRGGRGAALARLTRWIHEEAEEFRVGLEQHAGVAGFQARLVGLHRTVEREELGIPAEGFGEDAIALAIALAAGLLALRLRFGQQHRDIAVRPPADLL